MVTPREYRSPWRATHSRLGDATAAETGIVGDLFAAATAEQQQSWVECGLG